jgi:glycogen debranching enzyme
MDRVSLKARSNQHYVYSGQAILVTNLDGAVTGSGTEGFYFKNTRFLSREEILVDGQCLQPAAVSPVGCDSLLAYYEARQTASVPAATLYAEMRRGVGEGLHTEIKFTNYGRDQTLNFRVSLRIDADFADSDEAESAERQQVAPVERRWLPHRQELRLSYSHPALRHEMALSVVTKRFPASSEGECLVFDVALAARESWSFTLALIPVFDGSPYSTPTRVFPRPDSHLAGTRINLEREMPELTCSNDVVNRAWRTAVGDLASLPLGLPGAPAVPIAGFPLYQQFFGRDSLTISWQSLLATKTLMRDSLLANAEWQGNKVEDFYDEEPGKMIHQARWGPLSTLGLDPFTRYYGDWATPVDFLIMLGQYLLWTNDVRTVQSLLPAAKNVLAWIDDFGDKDRDGFLEYETCSSKGVKHQGWKDSDDAIVDDQGAILEPPLATCEIQAYWYAGLQQVAVAFLRCGDPAFAWRLLRQAAALKKRFTKAFWLPEKQFFATAIGPEGKLANSISSNAGHLLAAGIVEADKAKLVADRLLAPDMFSGWGVRTLSAENPFFNPFSYHRGSVWPVEQGTIAFGLARYGLWQHLHILAKAVFECTDLFAESRLPEVVGGMQRDEEHPHPGLYPRSCEPQGWSASMIVLLVQSLLGLRAIAPLNLLLIDPHLPEWITHLEIRDIRVAGATVDLAFNRQSDGSTTHRLLRKDGAIRVIRQPVPGNGLEMRRRFAALATSLPHS